MNEIPNPISFQLAKNMRDVHFGGNWTTTNLKEVLSDLKWEDVIIVSEGKNSILALVYHTHYFVKTLVTVLEENRLEGHDKFSFDHPKIRSNEE